MAEISYLHIYILYIFTSSFGQMRGRVTSGGCGASWNNRERLIPPGSDAIPLVNPKESFESLRKTRNILSKHSDQAHNSQIK